MAFKMDKREIQFILKEVLDLNKLLTFDAFKDFSAGDFDMVIEQGIKFATEKVAPLNKTGDQIGARYDKATSQVHVPPDQIPVYKQYCENGWMAPTGNVEYGGQGFPGTIGIALGEAFVGACVTFMMTPGLTRSAAHVIETFGTEEQKALFIEKMISGQWAGTMCLTEPSAGSAVGDLKTSAKPAPEAGENWYSISGTKSFITSGDHDLTENIIHLVLAHIEGEATGMKGISLFIVPKIRIKADGSPGEPNDIVCGGIEEKMGIHGSPTCTLNLGENSKCLGWLIGEKNKGIVAMFQMMNEARIGVGVQGMSQGAQAYQEALEYAKQRIQGVDILNMKDVNAPRVPIIKHPDILRMLMNAKAYVEGTRALLYKTAYYADIELNSPDKKEADKYKGFVELLTPICKAYATDSAFRVTELAIQVLGGYGYCREYPVEQYCRDVKITSIYEGTNGIQALDLLGRKFGLQGGMVLMNYMMEMNQFISANKDNAALNKYTAILQEAIGKFATLPGQFMKMSKTDPYYPVYHATPVLEMFGEIVCGYLLLEQAAVAVKKLDAIFAGRGADDDAKKKAVVADSSEAAFYHNKIETAKFFIANITPRVLSKEYAFKTGDRSALDAVL
jgi:alkylation response protein AidB-like acyl-CoA dehydrogenase